MDMKQVERIQKMEATFNDQANRLEAFEASIKDFVSHYNDFLRLYHYYGSIDYMHDVDAMNDNRLPEDLSCGVLTEDPLYDLIGDEHRVMEDVLDLVVKMVKKPKMPY